MTEDNMVLDIKYEIEDLYQLRINSINKKVNPFLRVTCGILSLILGGSTLYEGDLSRGIMVMMLGVFFLSMPIFAKYSVKRYANSNVLFSSVNKYDIRKDRLIVSYGNSVNNLEWSQFHRVEESKQAFYIYLSLNQAYIIPKRLLDDESLGAIRKYLECAPRRKAKTLVHIAYNLLIVAFCILILLVLAGRYL